jgi:hypothetical protein
MVFDERERTNVSSSVIFTIQAELAALRFFWTLAVESSHTWPA